MQRKNYQTGADGMRTIWEPYRMQEAPSNHNSPYELEFDVIIVGAGITGLLTGFFLNQQGLRIAILEADTAISGVTLKTTAKITVAPRLIYSDLVKNLGIGKAEQYAAANLAALSTYQSLIDSHHIDCDYEILPFYYYSTDKISKLDKELHAADAVGLDVSLVNEIELPFAIQGALRYDNQAQFNPVKFLNFIKKDLTIYEHTLVTNIKKHMIFTKDGQLSAKNIVITTHYPIINVPGFYFLRMHQERSYVLALENVPRLNGMYADINKNGYAFRSYHDTLLLSGNGHRTGENRNGGQYAGIHSAAKSFYPECQEVCHWSTQDCQTIDKLPYIGKYSSITPNLHVATGFGKWGMNHAMISAMILSDHILHAGFKVTRTSDYSSVFAPQRIPSRSALPSFCDEIRHTTENFIIRRLKSSNSDLGQLPPGQSAIVEGSHGKLGAYRDREGKLHLVSAVCPHLHCILVFNPEELTWDCPCHGSRIDIDGTILKNPAVKKH